LRYRIHTSLSVGDHIGPSPSSRFASASLRFAPSGDDASPMWRFVSMELGERSRPAGRLVSPNSMETKSLSRAQGSRLARERATREAGLALTPSTDRAQRTKKISNCDA
jgi:hypothetical protein